MVYVYEIETSLIVDCSDDKCKDQFWYWIVIGVSILLVVCICPYCYIRNKNKKMLKDYKIVKELGRDDDSIVYEVKKGGNKYVARLYKRMD